MNAHDFCQMRTDLPEHFWRNLLTKSKERHTSLSNYRDRLTGDDTDQQLNRSELQDLINTLADQISYYETRLKTYEH